MTTILTNKQTKEFQKLINSLPSIFKNIKLDELDLYKSDEDKMQSCVDYLLEYNLTPDKYKEYYRKFNSINA